MNAFASSSSRWLLNFAFVEGRIWDPAALLGSVGTDRGVHGRTGRRVVSERCLVSGRSSPESSSADRDYDPFLEVLWVEQLHSSE